MKDTHHISGKFENDLSKDFLEMTEDERVKHIWNSTRFKFQLKYPYDWLLKNDFDVLDDYGNLK